jgi:hypothetical protein
MTTLKLKTHCNCIAFAPEGAPISPVGRVPSHGVPASPVARCPPTKAGGGGDGALGRPRPRPSGRPEQGEPSANRGFLP